MTNKPEPKDLKSYVSNIYQKTYKREYDIECQKSNITSQSARLKAQRKAIDKALVESLLKYSPQVPESDIWNEIGMVHKLNVAQLDTFGIPQDQQADIIERCLSAHQSWIKSSGHSFERYISNIESDILKKNEIRFILQSELTYMIRHNLLANTKDDINGLKSWGKDFDLYSVAVTLDGSFLSMPEFIHMVNGGGSYKTNGWHGMYAMSGIEDANGRIYKVDDSMLLLINHAVSAAKQFISDRRRLNVDWIPE